MIIIQEIIGALLNESQVSTLERCPAKFLTPEGPVEALNESLVILLVGTGNHLLSGIQENGLGKLLFKF